MKPAFTHRVEVRFRDCDPMKHVNHAVYFTYLEQARFAHWRKVWDYGEAATLGVGTGVILARAECDFKAQARYGDVLDVGMAVAAIGRRSFTYEYEIHDTRDGRLVAAARTVQVMFDYSANRSVPIPAEVRRILETM